MERSGEEARFRGLLGTTGIGVGAIVGGGILALAGVAFATTGPSAIVAFGLNGAIAFLTVLSFSELATRFPESGGTYTYARKVLGVEAAFAVGWVVWFASIVASVLYAIGFAVFLVPLLEQLIRALGATPPAWLGSRVALLFYSVAAVAVYVESLARTTRSGGQLATVGKVIIFATLVAAGFWGLATAPPSLSELSARFHPFFSSGAQGLAQAMGYTFVALQGFDLIAAVGGEVRDPERNIPRAMLLSLGAALAIYLPLLFLIVAVGSPGVPVSVAAAADPETMVAVAARSFLGPLGYWLVIVAGVLSMLSALQANLLAASRFARTMATDRTLPRRLADIDPTTGTPVAAIRLTGAAVALVLVAVPDVAAAGAVASLIFLASFALAHGVAYLARVRAGSASPFESPAFPLVPLVGGSSCLAIGVYQAVTVPTAGVLTALWLSLGALLFVARLGPRARAVDASIEALEPEIMRLRGRSPLFLVPIANPEKAESLVMTAAALAPHGFSRIQLLSVVRIHPDGVPEGTSTARLEDAQAVLGAALGTALSANLRPEALITLSDDPWREIARVAEHSRCGTVILGVGRLDRSVMSGPLERLMGRIDADVVILRAPSAWRPDQADRILVPSRGGRDQSPVRARLLGSLCRSGQRDVEFLTVLPTRVDDTSAKRAALQVQKVAQDETPGAGHATVLISDDLVDTVVKHSADCDLLVVGVQRDGRRAVFSDVILGIAEATECPLILISQKA